VVARNPHGVTAAGYVDEFHRTGDLRRLDAAIAIFRAADDADNLGTALLARFERTGRREDLDEGLALLRGLAVHGGVTIDRLCWLAQAYEHRHRLDGGPADLDAAIALCRTGLDRAGPGDDRALLRHVLGRCLRERHRLAGDATDLDEAIVAQRDAAAGHPLRPGMLVNLVDSLRAHFERYGDEASLDDGIAAADEACAGLSAAEPIRADALHHAGVLRRYRYERTGAPGEIEAAVRALREASSAPGDTGIRADSLSIALIRRFEWTGDDAALAEAIDAQRRAVAATPAGDPERDRRTHTLATALRDRYLHFADLRALRESVDLLRGIRDDPRFHATLGVAAQDMWWHTGDPSWADEAVVAARSAPDEDPVRARHTLANALRCRFAARGVPDDLRAAIDLLEQVLRDTPFGTADHGRCLGNLGGAWLEAYRRFQEPAALDRAVAALGRAIRADSVPAPQRAWHQQRWAEALGLLFDRTGDPAVLRRMTAALAAAATNEGATPMTRLLAARDWAGAAARTQDWETARAAAGLAIDQIPYAAGRRLARTDREHGLAQLNGVAADAAACALQTGEVEVALRWLEQGRGVLLTQALESRGDLTDLRGRHPESAADWVRTNEALNDPDLPSERRHALAVHRDDLLARIRALPGLASFLMPPPVRELCARAVDGPIVLVNVSPHRCDALAVTTEGVTLVPLPGADADEIQRRADLFTAAIRATERPGAGEAEAQRTVAEVLDWLAETVTGPVLDRLGPGVTRVWWSPGGPLTALPLHASALDRVISSYTPTARALRAPTAGTGAGLLVVAMPETEGERSLPYARREAAAVAAAGPARTLIAGEATRDAVVAALRDHESVHFACHAVSDAEQPSRSSLLVHDHRERPLTLLDVSRLELPAARLAYLSACHTARGPTRLADEALHITGAFHLAGYSSVVGTLWQVNDRIASEVAADFHTRWRAEPGDPAAALHRCVHELRRRFPRTPSLWSAYVHYGR
jgi:hypothetical protein